MLETLKRAAPWMLAGVTITMAGQALAANIEVSGKSDLNVEAIAMFLLFVVALLLFILAPGFGNSTYFIFLTMCFLDPMAGLVVTTVTARRDLAVTDGLQKQH